ncbi:excisionase family DNA-binding protein [Corynebacterium sp.]|uniref:excisionase family DNA-binding protein n=1 Tax=Corynebacterium TaxID=1716 RepID=UPI00258938F8|nr:helix-turn-helix domain-containing protein [Corynebacterium sp.]
MTAASKRRYSTIKAAAEYAATSDKTIRRWIAQGKITGYRVGTRFLRVDLNEIDSMMTTTRDWEVA